MDRVVLGGKYQSVNIRREPKEGNNVLGIAPRGVVLETIGEQDGYYKVIAYVRKDAANPHVQPSDIPWVSQVARANPDALTANDCQQACLSMVYEWKTGLRIAPDEITKDLQNHPSWYDVKGNWVPGKYTTINQGVSWLNWRGIAAARRFYNNVRLPDPGSIVLINYAKLRPENAFDKAFYQSADAFHFVVFLSGNDQTVTVNDPLWLYKQQGGGRTWSRQEWDAAFTGSTIGV